MDTGSRAKHVVRGGLATLLGLVLAAPFPGCARVESPPQPSLVVLISLDTLRKDAVGAYGGEGGTATPALTRFAGDAVLVEGARTPIPFTLPAHMSLFTGVAPMVHGVSNASRRLGDAVQTLPEFLRDAGFATHGIAVNYWMKGAFGFDRGFDSYELLRESLRPGVRVTRAALELLDERSEQDEPLFLFLQFFDAHSASSEIKASTLPYYSRPGLREGLFSDEADEAFCSPQHGCATGFLVAMNAGDVEVSQSTLGAIRELYAKSARDLDDQLAAFFEGLRKRGLYDGALIIVVSDHGEEFREHGRVLHSQTYEETVAVPLLVKFPGGRWAGRRVTGLAGLTDILPTLLDELGLPIPEFVTGESLLPLLEGRSALRDGMVSQDKHRPARFAMVQGDVKLIFDFESELAELYDLHADPAEQHNLAKEDPVRVAALRTELASRIKGYRALAQTLGQAPEPPREPVLTESELDALHSLGYLREVEN